MSEEQKPSSEILSLISVLQKAATDSGFGHKVSFDMLVTFSNAFKSTLSSRLRSAIDEGERLGRVFVAMNYTQPWMDEQKSAILARHMSEGWKDEATKPERKG